MVETVGFDPETAPLEQLEEYLSQDPQQDDAAAINPEPVEQETEYVDLPAEPEKPAAAAAEPAQEAPVTYSQQDYDAALGRKAKEVRESVQRSDDFSLGRDLINRRAAMEGISRKEAAKRIRDEMFAQEAERLSKDPKALAEAVLRAQMPQQPEPEPEAEAPATPSTPSGDDRVRSLATAVRASMQAGRLPVDFSVEQCLQVYPGFFDDAKTFGEAAAVRIAESKYEMLALQQKAQQQATRLSLPRSVAPQSQPAPAPRDFSRMSDEEFERIDRDIGRSTNAGIHVRV